jgi:hypothetical protein
MFSTKTRTAIIAVVASASFTGASVAPTVASALPVETAPRQGCILYFKDQLGGEKRLEMADGDTVTLNGKKYKCVNGNVVTVKMESPVVSPISGTLASFSQQLATL